MELPNLERVDGRWFVGGCLGIVSSNGYFYCHEKTCPFSVKLRMCVENGKKVLTAVEKLVFPLHCHERTDFSKPENKDFIANELQLIAEGKDDGSLQQNTPDGNARPSKKGTASRTTWSSKRP